LPQQNPGGYQMVVYIGLAGPLRTPLIGPPRPRCACSGAAAPRRDLVGQIAARIAKGAGVIVAVGLSRPWQKLDDTVERHWLQVNNIHLEDDPAWQDRALPV
jgi:hypothetical protein